MLKCAYSPADGQVGLTGRCSADVTLSAELAGADGAGSARAEGGAVGVIDAKGAEHALGLAAVLGGRCAGGVKAAHIVGGGGAVVPGGALQAACDVKRGVGCARSAYFAGSARSMRARVEGGRGHPYLVASGSGRVGDGHTRPAGSEEVLQVLNVLELPCRRNPWSVSPCAHAQLRHTRLSSACTCASVLPCDIQLA